MTTNNQSNPTTEVREADRRRGSVNVSEKDFTAVACAALEAQTAGDSDQARTLDKLARKINAALTSADPLRRIATFASGHRSVIRWQDMPSVLEASNYDPLPQPYR